MTTEMKDVSKMTDAERQAELLIDADRRTKNCMIDIENALKRYGCMMDCIVTISREGVTQKYRVIPLVKVDDGKNGPTG